MKDIKTKPKTIKRSHRPVKDIKTVMKRQYIRQKAAVKPQTSKPQQQEDKPENYATDAVENATHGLADTAYHQSKSYVQNKIKKHKAEKIREKETSATSSDTDLTEIITSQHNNTEKTGDSLHTDGELRNTPKQQNEDVLHNTSLPHEQRQQYVERKPKRQIEPISDAKRSTPHSEVDMPTAKTQVQVKTKDYYIKTHQQPRKASYRLTPNTPKQNTPTSTLPYSNKNAVLKNKKSTFSLKHSARTDISKVKNMAVKTQKQITKQAAKQAVKRSAKVAM